jgi:hypothetical protein
MKTHYNLPANIIYLWIFFFSFSSFSLYAQITNIPDLNFEQALIDLGIDSDGIINGQVLTSDIENVTELNVVNEGIFDLTGIEGFASLESLEVSRNSLSTLDVSNNIQLKELHCSNDSSPNMTIESLDLSNNINLELLYAEDLYFLEELNLKNGNNAILNVELTCTLDLGDPCFLPLTCVTVDDEVAATNDEPPYDTWFIAAQFIYSEDCTLGISSQEDNLFSIYPNPSKDELFLSSVNNKGNLNVKIFSIAGKLLNNQNLELEYQNGIDVSKLSRGVYFLNMADENGNTIIMKFLKK